MAEKQTFVQIVDQQTGMVERVADMKEIEAMSVEDKLALARGKTLYVVSHKLEPVIKVEMRKVSITPVSYKDEKAAETKPESVTKPQVKASVQVKPQPKPEPKVKPVAKTKADKPVKQAEIPLKPTPKGKAKK